MNESEAENISKCPFHNIKNLLPLSPWVGWKMTPIKKRLSSFTYHSTKQEIKENLVIDDLFIEKVIKNPKYVILVNDIGWLSKHLAREYYKYILEVFKSSLLYEDFFKDQTYRVDDFSILFNLYDENWEKSKNKELTQKINSLFVLSKELTTEWSIKERFLQTFRSSIEELKTKNPILYNRFFFYNILMDEVVLGPRIEGDRFDENLNLSPIFWMIAHNLSYINKLKRAEVQNLDNTKVPEYFYEKAKVGSHYHAALLESLSLYYSRITKWDYIDINTGSYKERIKNLFKKHNIELSKKQDKDAAKLFGSHQKLYNTNIKWMDSPMYLCPAVSEFGDYYKLTIGLIHAICLENKDFII